MQILRISSVSQASSTKTSRRVLVAAVDPELGRAAPTVSGRTISGTSCAVSIGMKKKQPNKRPTTRKEPTPAVASNEIEERLLAFAKQLGFMVGTVQAKTEGWLDREVLTNQISRIRDSATELLAHVTPMPAAPPKAAVGVSRGPVDAPRKRHRPPPPQERLPKRMGEPRGKQMGQKSAKGGQRRGRG